MSDPKREMIAEMLKTLAYYMATDADDEDAQLADLVGDLLIVAGQVAPDALEAALEARSVES